MDRHPGAAPALGRATWTDIDRSPPAVVLVPVGSCEQHGPHLPLDTDTRVAVAVAGAVAAERSGVVVAPAVAYGSSGEHQSFPGTLSIGADALATLLVELARSALPDPSAARRRHLVFVNGHGGNDPAVRRAVEVCVHEGRPVSAWSPAVPGGDAHAGRTETSLLLAVSPEAVRPDRPVGATEPVTELIDRMRAGGVASVAANGVLGDARGASAAHGHEVLRTLVADLGALVDGLG